MKKLEIKGQTCYFTRPVLRGQVHYLILSAIAFIAFLLNLTFPSQIVHLILGVSGDIEIYTKILWHLFLYSALIPLGVAFYRVYSQNYYIFNDRIECSVGIITKNKTSLRYDHIRSITANQNVFERVLFFGDIFFATAGTGGNEITFLDVGNPSKVADTIEGLLPKKMISDD